MNDGTVVRIDCHVHTRGSYDSVESLENVLLSAADAGLPFGETVTRIRNAGGLAVVPHPFQRSRHGIPADAITDCDGIEVFNAHTLTGLRNWQATRFAVRGEYPRFAGSDAHRAAVVGSAYTEVRIGSDNLTAEAVLAAMRAGRVRPVGNRISPRRYFGKLAWSAKHSSARLLRGD